MDFRRKRNIVVVLLLVIPSLVIWMQWKGVEISERMHKENIRYYLRRNITQQFLDMSVSPTEEFEPDVLEDIQTIPAERPRIPHIIHFIFITDLKGKSGIPAMYRSNVQSFTDFNPKWTYYFWTETTARQLIAAKYPGLLSTWDSYKLVINKADALRYVVLHEFGGVYTDLDMQCKRSLDRATMKYTCILTPEPFQHSAILLRVPFLLSTAFMMCQPKHPFMKQLISSLPHFVNRRNMLAVAGPMFLTLQFKKYNKFKPGDAFRTKLYNESNSPYFYKGTLREDHINAIYVANTHYFMKSFDLRAKFFDVCKVTQSLLVKRGCHLLKNGNEDKVSYSYTDHFWRHMYSIRNSTQMIPIAAAIPKNKLKIWQL